MWGEIRRAHGQAKIRLGGELLQTEVKIDPKRYAFGLSTDQPTNFSGIHADWVLNRSADENYMPDAGLC